MQSGNYGIVLPSSTPVRESYYPDLQEANLQPVRPHLQPNYDVEGREINHNLSTLRAAVIPPKRPPVTQPYVPVAPDTPPTVTPVAPVQATPPPPVKPQTPPPAPPSKPSAEPQTSTPSKDEKPVAKLPPKGKKPKPVSNENQVVPVPAKKKIDLSFIAVAIVASIMFIMFLHPKTSKYINKYLPDPSGTKGILVRAGILFAVLLAVGLGSKALL